VILGLLGSGEFEPWAREVDRRLLAGARDGPVLVVPTASAPEGREVFDRWAEKGLGHYRGQGVDADVLPLRTRDDAGRPELAERVRTAALVFFSGGNPKYLASVLDGTACWAAITEELRRGLAYGGCSAGAAVLGERALWRLHGDNLRPALGFFKGTNVGPHWDGIDRHAPGLRPRLVEALGAGARIVGIDERTAVVGDGRRWSVIGSGGVHVLEGGRWTDHPAGSTFDLTLLPGEGGGARRRVGE
jgi:cyanophycinase